MGDSYRINRELAALSEVEWELPFAHYSIKPCRHGYTFCLGEVISPGDRHGRGLQLYAEDHYTGTIGFMELTPRRDLNVLYINLLGVEPEHRGEHYSSAMVRWAVRAAQALRLSYVEAPSVIGVPDGNDAHLQEKLENIFSHNGFSRIGKNDWRRVAQREKSAERIEERI